MNCLNNTEYKGTTLFTKDSSVKDLRYLPESVTGVAPSVSRPDLSTHSKEDFLKVHKKFV